MRKNGFIIILAIVCLSSIVLNIQLYTKLQNENIVTEVVDGDTFQLASGKRVRLMGVDAPEYDRCGGREAKNRLGNLILGKKVLLKEEADEAYGRTLALVYRDNTLINKIMLEEGWGRTDYRKNSQREILTSAYHTAQVNKIGIWSLCRKEDKVPSDCTIKGNIDKATYEKFYHLPSCRHYNEIVIEEDRGERFFCSEEEASKAGFKKAGGC